MSEYQYYEFQAIDKPLTAKEREALRCLSSRAQITSTSFTNTYHWGDFSGKPRAMMEEFFDAFLYLANWGTHWFMLRLPRTLLNPEVANEYCYTDCASAVKAGDHVILDFTSEIEDCEWIEDEGDWLSSLVQLRADLARGDYRCLYLAWLLSAQQGELDDDELEPPVPPNLKELTEPLQCFADFLRIDDDLIEIAAQNSTTQKQTETSEAELKGWIAHLSQAEKEDWLLKLATNKHSHLGTEFQQRLKRDQTPVTKKDTSAPRRTVANLLQMTEAFTKERCRLEAEKKAREKARREIEEAEARKRYLLSINENVDAYWGKVDALINTKQPQKYEQAVTSLINLRDLAELTGTQAAFSTRMTALRTEHARKPALMQRFREAML